MSIEFEMDCAVEVAQVGESKVSLGLGAREIAERIRTGELSSREVVEEHIRRIEDVNPPLNAIVVPLFDRALEEATVADAARTHGEPLGPLHGVPITIKEQFLVAGTPTTAGLPSRAGHLAAADGPLIGRLRRAGAIILGKTNVSQLMIYHESDNPVYGRTNNPWDLRRTPGGSTGGEAAIIAAGGSSLGLGSDLGGSVRIPAHFCGIHGLKPTTGRLTNLDTPAEFFSGQEVIIPQTGPIARKVEDLALAMGVLCTPVLEALDPTVPPVPWKIPADLSLDGMRVAMYTDDGFFRPAPSIKRAVHEAASALRTRGAQVEEWAPPDVGQAARLFIGIASADGGAGARRILDKDRRDRRIASLLRAAAVPNQVRPAVVRLLKRTGQRHMAGFISNMGRRSTADYWRLTRELNGYRAGFLTALDAGRFDAIICPPHGLPALTHGGSEYLLNAASYSLLYNVLGMPAGVIATTRVRRDEESARPPSRDLAERAARKTEADSIGLPVGVQVVARHWREDIALRVMAVLEEHFQAQPDYPTRPAI
jgi:fatty acid amide hydrolase